MIQLSLEFLVLFFFLIDLRPGIYYLVIFFLYFFLLFCNCFIFFTQSFHQ